MNDLIDGLLRIGNQLGPPVALLVVMGGIIYAILLIIRAVKNNKSSGDKFEAGAQSVDFWRDAMKRATGDSLAEAVVPSLHQQQAALDRQTEILSELVHTNNGIREVLIELRLIAKMNFDSIESDRLRGK